MAGMQDIEAAIGETDAQAFVASTPRPAAAAAAASRMAALWAIGPCAAKQRAGEFFDRQPRGAALADHHAGRGVGDGRGDDAVGARSQRQRERSDDRVAGAGNVEHLPRLRGDVAGIVRVDDAHALFAARRDDEIEAMCRDQLACRGHDLVIGENRAADRLAEFLAVGRNRGRAGIACIVAALGVDQHRLVRRRGRSAISSPATPSSSMPLP